MVLKALVDPCFGSSGTSPGLFNFKLLELFWSVPELGPAHFYAYPLPEMINGAISDLALNDRKCVLFFGGRPHKHTLVCVCYEQSQMKQFGRE